MAKMTDGAVFLDAPHPLIPLLWVQCTNCSPELGTGVTQLVTNNTICSLVPGSLLPCELAVPQYIMWPSTVRANGAVGRHSTAQVSHISSLPCSSEPW